MKRLWKWTGALLGFIVVAFLVAVAAVVMFLDPNQFKPLIISQFKHFTGFEMNIPGNLSWSFFPHLGMKADEVEVKDVPDFTSKMQHLVLRVKLGPLFRQQLEFSKVSIGELQVNQLQATQVDAKMKFKDQVLEIKPVTANFYQGTLSSTTSVALNGPTPVLHVAGDLNNVDMASLIAGMSGKVPALSFEGRANVKMDVNTQGKQTNELLKQLNGTGSLSIDNGVLKGVDIAYYVDTAVALINKQPLPARQPSNATDFGHLTGTGVIKEGILYNQDLFLESPLFTTKGNGTVDLVNKTLDYHLNVTVKLAPSNNTVLALAGKTVPIRVTGSLNDPSVTLDTLALMQEIGKEQLQEVQEKIQKALPDKANKFLQQLFH